MSGTATALSVHGQPNEPDCPYQTADPHTSWSPPAGVHVFRRSSTHATTTFTSVQAELQNGYVPVLGIAIPNGFHLGTAPWILNGDGTNIGLHAIAAVGLGHISSKELILIRNSWGPSWADAGHAWIDQTFFAKQVLEVLVLTTE